MYEIIQQIVEYLISEGNPLLNVISRRKQINIILRKGRIFKKEIILHEEVVRI